MRALRESAASHGIEVVQIPAPGEKQRVAAQGSADGCDLIVSIGGDGTALAGARAAAQAGIPVLGIACGSLGALAGIDAGAMTRALDRFVDGDWIPYELPALQVARDDGPDFFALNDFAIIRGGEGQIRLSVRVDGSLFARLAGDGCIVSTPIGSSAYSLAAHGPLLTPDVGGYLVTPLTAHGGSVPPLVVGAGAAVELDPVTGYGGGRLEVDGHQADTRVGLLRVGLRAGAATLVRFADRDSFLTGLRRRRIIIDSPRILAEDDRDAPGVERFEA